MTEIARIAIVAGDTPASRAVAGAVRSLLTAVGRWVVEVAADADLAGHALVVLPGAVRGARYGRATPVRS